MQWSIGELPSRRGENSVLPASFGFKQVTQGIEVKLKGGYCFNLEFIPITKVRISLNVKVWYFSAVARPRLERVAFS